MSAEEATKTVEVAEDTTVESTEKGNVQNNLVQQLFARLAQEIEANNPTSVIHFIVGFLCKHYPEHLQGFASIFGSDDLEFDRLAVVEFFRFQKIPVDVAAHFTNAGFDTLETLSTVNNDTIEQIEQYNQSSLLPGHKIRLQQIFADFANRVKLYREEKESALRGTPTLAGFATTQYPSIKPALTSTASLKFPNQLPAPVYRYPIPGSTVLPPQYVTNTGSTPYQAIGSNTRAI